MTAILRGRRSAAPSWDPAATHREVLADGTALHVAEEGSSSPGAPCLVLLHGWTQDHTCWDRVVANLRERSGGQLRILRYDHRGHGGSAPALQGSATIGVLADDLAELLASRLPTGQMVLAGHSMGGATVMALAERHPHLVGRIAGIAYVSTTSGGLSGLTLGLPRQVAQLVYRGEPALSKRVSKSDREIMLRHSAVLAPLVRRTAFGRKPRRVDVADTAAQIGRCHPASAVGLLDSLLAHDRVEVLDGLRHVPSVVLVGSRDRLTPLRHARMIASRLPDAEFVIYPEAGHMLPVERADEVSSRIAALLGAAVPPGAS
ncbi:MAG: alpha/beta fold hydrolase [Sciscionella sp.]